MKKKLLHHLDDGVTFLHRLVDGVSHRQIVLLAALLGLLFAAPHLLGKYGLSVLILVLYFAYVGQAWNIMMGFAGQLSLGHALYAGLGGYVAAGLFLHYGIGPWAGAFAAAAAAVLAGTIVGYLGFRFSLAGVYFALLTIAFGEFTRIAFDHFDWAGGAGGLFLKVDAASDPLNLRGGPLLFYYVILGLAVGAFVLCRLLLESRFGRYWLAIREDAEAAQAVGVPVLRYKMYAVMISSALTSLAGVWNAFYYNNLFPETAFGIGRSIEMTLAPIIGGLGTLFGPIVGAVVLAGLGEVFTSAGDALGIPGIKQIFYGLALILIVMYRPSGVWPWLAAKLGGSERRR
jgi:branched-chain amino acid transport system permease protein